MALRKTGNWEAARALCNGLSEEIGKGVDDAMMQIGLKAEGTAKKHISSQDLGWQKLKARTIASKVRKGQSTLTLVATSTYFQAITSWYEKRKRVLIGVKRGVIHTSESGEQVELANIAAVHEYGSRSGAIVARPLWRPTLKEIRLWIKSSGILKIAINARLSKFKK